MKRIATLRLAKRKGLSGKITPLIWYLLDVLNLYVPCNPNFFSHIFYHIEEIPFHGPLEREQEQEINFYSVEPLHAWVRYML